MSFPVASAHRSGEETLIARYFKPLATDPSAFDLADDAAILRAVGEDAVAATDVVVTTDAVVEGVHFLAHDPPDTIARKALRVNLPAIAYRSRATRLPRQCATMPAPRWMCPTVSPAISQSSAQLQAFRRPSICRAFRCRPRVGNCWQAAPSASRRSFPGATIMRFCARYQMIATRDSRTKRCKPGSPW